MQINWFEIVAQMINFFILLFLLQKFFYKPVVNAMEERQKRISKAQEEAEEKSKKADGLIQKYDHKMVEIKEEKREILEKAQKEAQEKKEKLLQEYKEEAEEKRKNFFKEIQEEKELFMKDLRIKLGQNAVKIASAILDSISSKELEEEIFQSFLEKICHIEEEVQIENFSLQGEDIILTSYKVLSKDRKERLKQTLKKSLGDFKELSFEVEENLIIGYELKLETFTIHTNIRKYLEEVEKNILETLEKAKV